MVCRINYLGARTGERYPTLPLLVIECCSVPEIWCMFEATQQEATCYHTHCESKHAGHFGLAKEGPIGSLLMRQDNVTWFSLCPIC